MTAGTESVDTLVDALRGRLLARRSPPAGPPVCYVFRVNGPGGGDLYIVVERGSARAGAGRAPVPVDCTIELEMATALGIITGRINPALAYMTGKVKVRGDLGAAGRLGDLLGG